MSIKKLSRKRSSQPSNLTIRMVDDRMLFDRMMYDRMASDRMGSDKGPGSIAGGFQRPVRQNNLPQRSEDVHQKDSSEK
jgi:hypothetical protein